MNRDTTYKLQFRGRLQMSGDNSCPVVATMEFETYDPSSLEVNVLFIGDEKENRVASHYLQYSPYNYIWLQSDEGNIPAVEVLGIHRLEISGLRASIGATAVQIGLSKEPIEQDTIFHIKIELTPSGILVQPGIRELVYTGETRFRPIVEGRIEVPTTLGVLEVGQRYAHYKSEEYGNEITHSVQRVSLTGKISISKGQDLFSINESLEENVNKICRLLSLCYRQPVKLYEIEYFPNPETIQETILRRALLRVRLSSHEKKIDQDELINYRSLVDGGLDKLLRDYQDSNHKEEIFRVIGFLSASYKMATLVLQRDFDL